MSIRRLAAALAAAFVTLALAAPARAELTIDIDKASQRMTVALNGAALFDWPVSTGLRGYNTPSGAFTPFRMERDHFSREWDDAPMPNSIFFTRRGHAIHGSYHKNIGRPASHGCVRLEPKNAAILYDLVRQEGMKNTRVVLHGQTPGRADAPAVAHRQYDDQNGGDDDFVGSTPSRRQRVVGGWREYNNGSRYFYDRPPSFYAPARRYDLPFALPFTTPLRR